MSKPVVVFLDMDGVLCSARVQVAAGVRDIWSVLDPVSVQYFNRFAGEVEYVISSAWRKYFEENAMKHILQAAGWRGKLHTVWCTPSHLTLNDRPAEVQEWLHAHQGARGFVVVDDLPFDWPAAWSVVQTHEREGMLADHYIKFEHLLRKEQAR